LPQASNQFVEILQKQLRVYGLLGFGRQRRASRDNRRDFIQLELARNFFHQVRRNWPQVVDVCIDQRMFAEKIHDAGNTMRIQVDRLDCFFREDRFTICARNAQAFGDVTERFFERKGRCPTA